MNKLIAFQSQMQVISVNPTVFNSWKTVLCLYEAAVYCLLHITLSYLYDTHAIFKSADVFCISRESGLIFTNYYNMTAKNVQSSNILLT